MSKTDPREVPTTDLQRTEDTEVLTIGAPFPRIAKVQALENFCVLVTWKDAKPAVVDLAPSILSFKLYAPLRNDRALFESVHVVDDGVIAWGEQDSIDMHVSEIDRLAGKVMDASSFRDFLNETGLTGDAAAAQLGISRRMVGYYASGHPVPRYIALATAKIRDLLPPQTSAAKEASLSPARTNC